MSNRQIKKRKGKVVRERTVTTLTGADDQSTQSFHIPSSDDPTPPGNIMSSPFSVASSSGANNSSSMPPPMPFHIPTTFTTFGYNSYMHPMPPHMHSPSQFRPDPSLPPGPADLEALERLKEAIKNNEHEIYRAVPQPAVLASLYKGLIDSVQSHVPPHPEQVPPGYQGVSSLKPGFDAAPQQLSKGSSNVPPGLTASNSSSDVSHAHNGSTSWDLSSSDRNASVSSVAVGSQTMIMCCHLIN